MNSPDNPFSPATRRTAGPLLTPEFDEALSRALFVIEGRRRGALIEGSTGLGKTLLLQLAEQQTRSPLCCWLTAHEAITHVATAEHTLQGLAAVGGHLVLTVDAVDPTPGHSTALQQWLRLGESLSAATTLLLTHDPESLDRVPRELARSLDLRITLAAWSLEDAHEWIRTRVSSGPIAFSDDAVVALFHASAGVPREFLRLGDFVWLAAQEGEHHEVTRSLVESIVEELPAALPPTNWRRRSA